MLSINNNNCDYTERERHVIELYDQGKSTRDIAKELRMSLRDISSILRKNQVSHGLPFPIIDNDNNNNTNKSPNQKSTQAYKLFSEGKEPLETRVASNLPIMLWGHTNNRCIETNALMQYVNAIIGSDI